MVATSSHNPEVIFNLSSHELTSSRKYVLSKGLRLAIPPRQIDYSSYLAEFQLPYRSTTDLFITLEDRERFKVKLKDIPWSSYKHLNDNWKDQINLSSEWLSSLKTPIRNKNIVTQKADKGNNVIITDKEKYIQVVKYAIADFSKFIPLNIPPEDYVNYIDNVEKNFWKLFNNLHDNNKISKDEFLRICPVGSTPRILYRNPKVHKPVVYNRRKFRRILSAINIPEYNLAKFLIPILEPLTQNEFPV